MHPFFAELGRTVSARWKAQNFSVARFPEIARRALEERPPDEHVDLAELVREFLIGDEQAFQTTSGFGEPEIVVFDDPRFYIQVLFWLDGTTDIHQHKFSGAFHVLAGSSLHSVFEFDDAESVSAQLRVGNLRHTKTQLLETGDTEPIVSGRGYIHSLFHLETPSATVVVRTHTDPGTGPQFTYLPPHLAVNPVHHDALTMRRKQLLDVLEKTNDSGYPDQVIEMLELLDFERGFFILQNCIGHLRDLGAWDDAWAAFRKRHGRLAAFVAPTLDEIIWRDALVALRGTVGEVEHRFFLALLLNVPRRADVLKFIGQRFPGSAVKTILRWATELMELSESGTWLLDAEFPPELETPLDDQPEAFLSTLRALLETGKARTRSKMPRPHLKAIQAALARSSLRVLVS